jgi:hypothetical protein
VALATGNIQRYAASSSLNGKLAVIFRINYTIFYDFWPKAANIDDI